MQLVTLGKERSYAFPRNTIISDKLALTSEGYQNFRCVYVTGMGLMEALN